METFSALMMAFIEPMHRNKPNITYLLTYALMAFCAGNSPVAGEFSVQRPVTRNFDVFFDLRLE